jgi:hypothetical protein
MSSNVANPAKAAKTRATSGIGRMPPRLTLAKFRQRHACLSRLSLGRLHRKPRHHWVLAALARLATFVRIHSDLREQYPQ